MDVAIHDLSGQQVTAREVAQDRRSGSGRFGRFGFHCPECKFKVSLRPRGKGDEPFFAHYPYSPPDCRQRRDNEQEADTGLSTRRKPDDPCVYETMEREQEEQIKTLSAEIKNYYGRNYGTIAPEDVDPLVAKFLAGGIFVPPPSPGSDVRALNAIRLLYQPSYVVLLRWLCHLVSREMRVDDLTPHEFANNLRVAFLSNGLVNRWLERHGGTSPFLTALPLLRTQGAEVVQLDHATLYAGKHCFLHKQARAEVIEVSKFPLEFHFRTAKELTLGKSRHLCHERALTSTQDFKIVERVKMSTPGAVALMKCYEGLQVPHHTAILYIVPKFSLSRQYIPPTKNEVIRGRPWPHSVSD